MRGHRGGDWREGDGGRTHRPCLPNEIQEASHKPEEAMTDISFSDRAELEESIVMDAAIWRGVKNAILPSLFMWALIALGVELARALLP